MEGIHILNTTVVMETVDWYMPVMIICGVLAGICFTIAIESSNDIILFLSIVVCILSSLTFIAVGVLEPKVETDRNRYEATIDETVSLTDVYEKYDVIEQRGKIWILEDKEK